MSLASAFDQQVQSYADQLENYNEQVDSYKNSLIEMRDQVKESTDALVEGVVSPIAAELLRTGVGQVFGAEAGEAAHVVRAVHAVTMPVPIMALRVTISASCSSLQPSVPGGRSGITR